SSAFHFFVVTLFLKNEINKVNRSAYGQKHQETDMQESGIFFPVRKKFLPYWEKIFPQLGKK
ncbi:hypothetical protein, partial [Bacteroides sp. CAG:633]|uniref:hypothetical protein n=1 Tax=Bacteroides sp. CAG:633 TaxID=1262744 RepID=UPI00258DF8A2